MPALARVIRAAVLEVMGHPYIESARALGAGDLRIMRRHVLPNIMAPLIVLTTLYFSQAILAEATLSFLGLGTQPPEAAWGNMLADARGFIDSSVWMSILPGLAIMITVLGFNFLGDGLRDILDPRIGGDLGDARDRHDRKHRELMLDLLVRDALVVDGTGAPPFRGDVAVEDGKIAAVGDLDGAQAERVIDAAGRMVCPGFVDPHSHSDFTLLTVPDRRQHGPPGRDDRGGRQLRLDVRAGDAGLGALHRGAPAHVRLRRARSSGATFADHLSLPRARRPLAEPRLVRRPQHRPLRRRRVRAAGDRGAARADGGLRRRGDGRRRARPLDRPRVQPRPRRRRPTSSSA